MRRRGRGNAARAHGFTLMEILVVLVLVAITVSLAFEMLGAYRLAKERVAVQADDLGRRALLEAWFIESIRGVVAVEEGMLAGAETRVAATSLNPVLAGRGAPTEFEWEIEDNPGSLQMVYREYGEERWRVALPSGTEAARFVYLEASGAMQPQWPPAMGMQGELPGSVALVIDAPDGRQRVMLASVRGPLLPRIDAFEMGED